MADEVAELGEELVERARVQLHVDRHAALVEQLGGEIALAVAARLHVLPFAGALHHAAAAVAHRAAGMRRGVQQLRHVDAQALADEHELVVRQRDVADLQLGQGGHGEAGAARQLGQRETGALSHRADRFAGAGERCFHATTLTVARTGKESPDNIGFSKMEKYCTKWKTADTICKRPVRRSRVLLPQGSP